MIASNQLSKATEPFWCAISFSSCRVFENQGMNSIAFNVHFFICYQFNYFAPSNLIKYAFDCELCFRYFDSEMLFDLQLFKRGGDKVFWQSCSKPFVGEPAGQKWVDLCSKLKKFWNNLHSNTKNQAQTMLKVLELEMFLWLIWVTYFHYMTPVPLQEALVAKLTVFVDFWIRGFKHLPNMWYLIVTTGGFL